MSEFEQYAEKLRTREDLISAVPDAQKLEIYALFKQGTVGDVNTARPGMFTTSFTANPKWDAWNGKKGMSKEDAQEAYVELLKELGVTL